MEKKTIGSFIATLRKANGMTQKELAERLNVSDKTISRWERDDGAPDIAVIPVLAEIFQVTCDELLRGERQPMAKRMEQAEGTESREGTESAQRAERAENVTSPKGEKQRQRILTVSLAKYKNKTFITMGIAAAGLIAAMIGNFGFLRAYMGFFVAIFFYLASIICQAVFLNQAFLSVADAELQDAEIRKFKRKVIRLAELSIGLVVTLFAVTLPLIVFPVSTYQGIIGITWIFYGAIFGMIVAAICKITCGLVNMKLSESGMYDIEQEEMKYYSPNRTLMRKCVLMLIVVMTVTCLCQWSVNEKWNSDRTYEEYVEGEILDEYSEADEIIYDVESRGNEQLINILFLVLYCVEIAGTVVVYRKKRENNI